VLHTKTIELVRSLPQPLEDVSQCRPSIATFCYQGLKDRIQEASSGVLSAMYLYRVDRCGMLKVVKKLHDNVVLAGP
jgi:hypothetical protein